MEEEDYGFSFNTKVIFWSVLGVLTGVIMVVLVVFTINIGNHLSNQESESREVIREVGQEAYDKIKKASEDNTKKTLTEQEKRVKEQDERNRIKKEILEQIGDQTLAEGNIWHEDEEGRVYQAPPVKRVETSLAESDYQVREEGVRELFESEPLRIVPPSNAVLDELSRSLEDIDYNKVYLTKGQFVYWLTDSLLYRTDQLGLSVSISWDAKTLKAIIKTPKEALAEVKRQLHDLITKVYNTSSYGIYHLNEITVEYKES